MPGSARRVNSAGDKTEDEIATETIGRSVSLNLLTIGSFISVGKSARIAEIASRTSCDATFRSLSNRNSIMSIEYPS